MFCVIFAADMYGVTNESVFTIIWCFGVQSGGLVAREMPVSNVMKMEYKIIIRVFVLPDQK